MGKDKNKVLTIFISSPSDVLEERKIVEDVVDEVNRVYAKLMGIQFVSFRADQDIPPDWDTDPQSAINKNLPEYHIFLGILWHTFGTPTPRAGSGTFEEFEGAKARHDKDSNVRLMLYFKTSPPLSLEDIDPDQLGKVREFKKAVGAMGGLYAEFQTPDDFASLLRNHLVQIAHTWHQHDEEPKQTEEVAETRGVNYEDEEKIEEGLLELEERIEETGDALEEILGSMTKIMQTVGVETEKRSTALEAITAKTEGRKLAPQERRKTRAEVRKILRGAASDMNRFSDNMETELPEFKRLFEQFSDTSAKALPLYLTLDNDNSELKNNAHRLVEGMGEWLTSMENLRQTVHELPKMSADQIRAGKRMERVLQQAIDIVHTGKATLEAVLSILSQKKE